jgi:hypothetical protein
MSRKLLETGPMQKASKKAQVARLEHRFLKKALALLPEPCHAHFRQYFRHVSTLRQIFRNSHTPFLDFERIYAKGDRRFLHELRKANPDASSEDLAEAEKVIEQHGLASVFKELRPQFEALKQQFNAELAHIDPRLIRGPDGGPTREEFKEICLSVKSASHALVSAKVRSTRSFDFAALDERTLKKALKLLPPKARRKFVQVWNKRWGRRFLVLKRFGPVLREVEYEYAREIALVGLQLARADQKAGRSAFETSRVLRPVVLGAMERNDLDFFVRMGDVLKRGQEPYPDLDAIKRLITKLQRFLFDHWTCEAGGVPALYALSINDLFAVCKQQLNQANLTPFAVEKTRQRLGLITFRQGVLGHD